MGDSSDGNKNDPLEVCEKSSNVFRKTRSFSFGSANLSKSEINQIIGISEKEYDGKQIKTYSNKSGRSSNSEAEIQIPEKPINDGSKIRGDFKKSHDQSQNTYEEVFAPKKTMTRTPPKKNYDLPDGTIRSKRPRSDSSPSLLLDRQKIPKHTFNTENGNEDSPQDTHEMVETLLGALEKICYFTEKKSFQQPDLTEMRQASFKLHAVVTKLVYRVGRLEAENATLQKTNQTQMKKNNNTSEESTTEVQNTNILETNNLKTYSSITKTSKKQDITPNEIWKTPEKTRNYEVLIKSTNSDQAVNIVKEIKGKMKGMGIFETFKNVRHLQSGGIILECYNYGQQKKLQDIIKTQKNLHTKELQNTDPMILITGIEKGYEPETFIKEFINDNPQITDIFGQNLEDKIKFITKKTCRNTKKENWILQTPPDIFKWIIRNDNLRFDLTKAYIQEYVNLAMCFNCCNFGHIAKYCKADPCCHKCGGEHNSRECSKPLDCPNCKRLNLSDRIHSARDQKCPAFVQKIQKQREYVNFNTNNKEHTFL